MKTKELKKIIEESGFCVTLSKDEGVICAELETWTTGGVNMIHYLNPFNVDSLNDLALNFDVDEEIDCHRQDQKYKDAFRITHSVDDFTEYYNRLKTLLCKIKGE